MSLAYVMKGKRKKKNPIPSFNQPFVLCDLNLRLNRMRGEWWRRAAVG